MNDLNSVKVIERYYEALDLVVANKKIRGVATFTNAHGFDRRAMYNVKKNPKSDMFQMSWMAALISDFGVSAKWLMTGVGGMFESDSK